MKETNEHVIIELTNMVTEQVHAWQLREHAVPTQTLLSMKDLELRSERAEYIREHKLPVKENAVVWDSISEEHQTALSNISIKSQKNMLDELKSMITLVGELPEGYKSQRELLGHCIGDFTVLPLIRNLFTERSGSSITSPGRGINLIRFKRPNGEYYDPFPEMKDEQVKVQNSEPKK